MLRFFLFLCSLAAVCNGSGVNPTSVLDINSAEYQTAFQDFVDKGGFQQPLSSADLQQLQDLFNDFLQKQGFSLIDSSQTQNTNNAQQAGTPAGTVPQPGPPAGTVPQPGPPAGAVPRPGPPAGAVPQPGPPAGAVPQPGPPAGTVPQPAQPPVGPTPQPSGFAGLRQTMQQVSTNQANNLFSGANEVLKGTDEFLTENSYQFQKLNSANKEFLKQTSRTKGAALTAIPSSGTRVMRQVESFVNNPSFYMNPVNLIRYFNPFRSMPDSREQILIDNLIDKIRTRNPLLHMKLTAPENASTLDWLREHPDIFIFLLEDRNNQLLTDIIDNPVELRNILQEIEAAKQR